MRGEGKQISAGQVVSGVLHYTTQPRGGTTNMLSSLHFDQGYERRK